MKVPSEKTIMQLLKICGGVGVVGTVCEITFSTDWAQKKILKYNLAKSTVENPRLKNQVYLLDIMWLLCLCVIFIVLTYFSELFRISLIVLRTSHFSGNRYLKSLT